MTTRYCVLFASSFRYESAPNISHETLDKDRTVCGRKLSTAETFEPDANGFEPDCILCRRGLRVSGPQAELLTSLAAGSELFVCGAQVGVARSLAKRGLARIEDNGTMKTLGRVDGERWSATLTDAGVQLAAIINARNGGV